jgi:hypothetical protein
MRDPIWLPAGIPSGTGFKSTMAAGNRQVSWPGGIAIKSERLKRNAAELAALGSG